MRPLFPIRFLPALSAAPILIALLLAGCAATRGEISTTGPGTPQAPAEAKRPPGKPVLPKEVDVFLRLSPGNSWKNRFVSKSETKRTLVGADGKKSVKTRIVGLELLATQKVTAVEGTVARVEVTEEETRILQEGKFVAAPYKQFHPPNPVTFTIDAATGNADFSAVREAYGKWMAEMKEGPVGDILGKNFRLASYLAALEEMYGKPFTRVSGKRLTDEETPSGKDVMHIFLGPSTVSAAVPVAGTMRYTGFKAKRGRHMLAVSGKYEGTPGVSGAEGLSERLADFGREAPKEFSATGSASGRFESTVDLLSGRELQSKGDFSYTAKWSFDGSELVEEVEGESILEPAE